jgi:hypothetical protein
MSCDVSLGEWDGDEAEFYNETTVTARKPHACHECRTEIAKGERHVRVSGKWDGELRTYRFCLACWEISGEFSERGRTFGIVWDEFQSQWGEGAHLQSCINRVATVAAKSKLREQWMKWKGLA